MKILVLQTAFLGDLLLLIPTLLRLRQLYPDSQITLLCRKGLGEIFRELKLANQVIEVNKKDKKEFSKTFDELKNQEYDLLICPHQSYRSGMMALKIKAKEKIGFKEWWNSLIFDKSLPRDTQLPDALRQLSLLSIFDHELREAIDDYRKNPKIPEITKMGLRNKILAHRHYNEIINKYNIPKNSVFIAPGSVWNTKRWTQEGFKKTAEVLSQKYPIVFIGSKDERALCEQIASGIPNSKNIAGETSILDLLVLMTTGRLLISNDSGAMHMGSVSELPTVAVFGPTVLELGYEPWQEKAIVVENKNLKCRPCGKHGHQKCPIGTHECMKSISADQVLEASQKNL